MAYNRSYDTDDGAIPAALRRFIRHRLFEISGVALWALWRLQVRPPGRWMIHRSTTTDRSPNYWVTWRRHTDGMQLPGSRVCPNWHSHGLVVNLMSRAERPPACWLGLRHISPVVPFSTLPRHQTGRLPQALAQCRRYYCGGLRRFWLWP
jgi:hypothetical protein